MSDEAPRMRMFAGPNGSGKSTIIETFYNTFGSKYLGIVVNADEIKKQIDKYGFLDFRAFGISTTQNEWHTFAVDYTNSFDPKLFKSFDSLDFKDDKLFFGEIDPESYYPSLIASFIREKLLEEKKDFTFETVMSHEGKVEFLKRLQDNGFKTYLYFVATEDPDINVSRVKTRVALGGHDVPEDKIRSRYAKSLDLLNGALQYSNRAYIFDNSGYIFDNSDTENWFAEYSRDDGWKIKIKEDEVPQWFINTVPSV